MRLLKKVLAWIDALFTEVTREAEPPVKKVAV